MADLQPNQKLYNNLAVAVLIACPLIAALPPRRLNLGTAGLGASWLLSANYLVRERFDGRAIQSEEEERMSAGTKPEVESGLIAEARATATAQGSKQPLIQLPSGANSASARASRAEEHRKKLDEGMGYGDIITEQVWQVWNQGKDEEE